MIQIVKKLKFPALFVLIMMVAVSCDLSKKYEKEEKQQIQQYLDNHPDLTFVLKPSGLYYLDVVVGTGPLAVTHDTAYVLYTGKYLDGTVFGTNIGVDTLIYPVNEGNLLPGFEEGVTYMHEGGKATLLIPSYLGYGNSGYNFPAYTPSLFDIELVKLIPGPGARRK